MGLAFCHSGSAYGMQALLQIASAGPAMLDLSSGGSRLYALRRATMSDRLHHYLDAWHLSEPRLLAETRTSHLYTVTRGREVAVLKLLTEYGQEEQRGALALCHFDGRGAVRLYRSDAHAQLLEYAAGDELVSLVEHGADEEATRIIADTLEQLHGVAQGEPAAGLLPLRHWFRELFRKAESERALGVESIYVQGADLAARLLANPLDVRVLHGDIHHRNIRRSSRGWLAFDPKGLVGERAYDCANALCNPFRRQSGRDELVHDEGRLLAAAGILADALKIDRARLLQFTFVHACLSATWALNNHDPDRARRALDVAALCASSIGVSLSDSGASSPATCIEP
jgi:streptomycin 6-kinase